MRTFLRRLFYRPSPHVKPTRAILPSWYTGRVTQEELVDREAAITRTAFAERRDPMPDLRAYRLSRWTAWLAAMSTPDELIAWESRMMMRYGTSTVQVWRAPVPWLIALLVVRYGEAEYWWPNAFSRDDLLRAMTWEGGLIPAGVTMPDPLAMA